MANEPLGKRRGWLKNGNPPGDFLEGAKVWSQDAAWHSVPVSSDAKRPLSAPRREEHATQDSRGP